MPDIPECIQCITSYIFQSSISEVFSHWNMWVCRFAWKVHIVQNCIHVCSLLGGFSGGGPSLGILAVSIKPAAGDFVQLAVSAQMHTESAHAKSGHESNLHPEYGWARFIFGIFYFLSNILGTKSVWRRIFDRSNILIFCAKNSFRSLENLSNEKKRSDMVQSLSNHLLMKDVKFIC